VFDVVTCSLVWRHVADPTAAVAECRRVLAPGGLLVLADAFDSRTVRPAPWRPAVASAAVRLCRALTAAGLPVLLAETVGGFGPVAEATVVIAGLPYDDRPAPDAPPAQVARPGPVPRAPVAAYRGAATAVATTVPTVWPGTGRW
jgi:SAM-dependent methyltransferase